MIQPTILSEHLSLHLGRRPSSSIIGQPVLHQALQKIKAPPPASQTRGVSASSSRGRQSHLWSAGVMSTIMAVIGDIWYGQRVFGFWLIVVFSSLHRSLGKYWITSLNCRRGGASLEMLPEVSALRLVFKPDVQIFQVWTLEALQCTTDVQIRESTRFCSQFCRTHQPLK